MGQPDRHAGHRRTASRRTGPSLLWRALMVAAMMTVVVASLALYAVTQPDASRVAADPVAPQDRICPVPSCTAYPEPGKIKGITLSTLTTYLLFTKSAKLQIHAAKVWGANAIRLQIVQDKLVGQRGQKISPRYLKDIRGLVHYARRLHLNVILNAQTEISMGFPFNENLPTKATFAFWREMTRYYGRNPHVVFDLFNEPRFCTWPQWRAAFQPLVTYLRSIGSRNQLWVEGLWWGSTLAGVPLLHGQGIVYSFHHPGSPWPWQSPVGPPTWNSAFGYLSREHIPLVDGEFVNFMGGYYWPRSTHMVTEYLHYLSAHHIGVVAWSLQPGVMTATTNLITAVSEPQGAGRLIWRYFHGETLPWVPALTEKVPFRFDRGQP
jgi:hypothetical protein